MEIRKIVRAARELQRFKIKEIAEKISKNKAGIANWERGIATLSEATIKKICQEIGIDYEKKMFLKKNEVFYFYLTYEKDTEYLKAIAEILDITEVVFFETFILLHESVIDNFYVIVLKEKNTEKTKKEVSSIFINAVQKNETENEQIKQLLQEKKLTKEDLNDFLYFTYCYQSRRVPVQTPDGSTSYVHEVPIGTIMRDFLRYIEHESNEEKKKKHLQDLVLEYYTKFEKVDKEEYEKRLEKVLKNFGL